MRSIYRLLAALGIVALVSSSGPALAHEQREVAGHSMVVGWSDEPTFAGFKNGAQVFVNELATGGQDEGPPVEDAELEVEILFGGQDAEESVGPVPLEPAFDSPGEYQATLIPTRPGQYTFHITGTLDDGEIDEFFTSGPDTFSDVADPDDIEFPAQDPSAGELAAGVEQLRAQLAAGEDAQSAAETARLLAIIGIAMGVIGIAVGAVALRRRPPAA